LVAIDDFLSRLYYSSSQYTQCILSKLLVTVLRYCCLLNHKPHKSIKRSHPPLLHSQGPRNQTPSLSTNLPSSLPTLINPNRRLLPLPHKTPYKPIRGNNPMTGYLCRVGRYAAGGDEEEGGVDALWGLCWQRGGGKGEDMSGLWSFTRRLFGEIRRGFLCHFFFVCEIEYIRGWSRGLEVPTRPLTRDAPTDPGRHQVSKYRKYSMREHFCSRSDQLNLSSDRVGESAMVSTSYRTHT
ncbi:hypothetical protein KCU76_g127, partial [Aureobasidium melanogenum]